MARALRRVDESFVDAEGVTTYFYRWAPRTPQAVIHLVHGLEPLDGSQKPSSLQSQTAQSSLGSLDGHPLTAGL